MLCSHSAQQAVHTSATKELPTCAQEDRTLKELVARHSTRWKTVAQLIGTKTDSQVRDATHSAPLVFTRQLQGRGPAFSLLTRRGITTSPNNAARR